MKLEYPDAVFWLWGSLGVYAIMTSAEGAETRGRVGVGDPLSLVRARYGRVSCGEAVQGEPIWSDEPTTYPWCMTRVGDVDLHFGGDPIESMTIARGGILRG